MNKYKIEFTETEVYMVDVVANTKAEAIQIATDIHNDGGSQDMGQSECVISNTYDVTNTDDPFSQDN